MLGKHNFGVKCYGSFGLVLYDQAIGRGAGWGWGLLKHGEFIGLERKKDLRRGSSKEVGRTGGLHSKRVPTCAHLAKVLHLLRAEGVDGHPSLAGVGAQHGVCTRLGGKRGLGFGFCLCLLYS